MKDSESVSVHLLKCCTLTFEADTIGVTDGCFVCGWTPIIEKRGISKCSTYIWHCVHGTFLRKVKCFLKFYAYKLSNVTCFFQWGTKICVKFYKRTSILPDFYLIRLSEPTKYGTCVESLTRAWVGGWDVSVDTCPNIMPCHCWSPQIPLLPAIFFVNGRWFALFM